MALQPIGEKYDVVQFDRPDKSTLNTGEKWLQPIQSPKDYQQWSKKPHPSGASFDGVYEPEQNQIVTPSGDGTVVAIDAITGTENWTHSLHSNDVVGITYDSERNRIVSAGGSISTSIGDYYSVNAETGSERWSSTFNHFGKIYDTAYDSTQDHILTVDSEGVVISSLAQNSSEQWSHSLHSSTLIRAVVHDPAQNRVVSGDINGTLISVDATDGSQQWSKTLFNNDKKILDLVYDPIQNNIIGVGQAEKMIAVSATDGSKQWEISLDTQSYAVEYDSEQNQVITGSVMGNLTGRNPTNGYKKWSHSLHNGSPISSVTFDPVQNNVVSMDDNRNAISVSTQIRTNEYIKQNGQLMLINSTI
jgi:hypothetical protein